MAWIRPGFDSPWVHRFAPAYAGLRSASTKNMLTQKEIKKHLAELDPAWRQKRENDIDRIEREFTFSGFPAAIAFVNKVAEIAEQEDHHPDIHINYDTVRITLSTHSAHGLSKKDFALAAKIDALD